MGRRSKNYVSRLGQTLRPCSRCHEAKDISEFTPRVGKGHVAACKDCMAALQKKDYYLDIEKSRKIGRDAARKIREPKQAFANSIKSSTPCADCDKKFPAVCMDFDHLPGTVKLADVAQMTNGTAYSLAEVAEEIEKCAVVCSNCHRLRTQKRSGL